MSYDPAENAVPLSPIAYRHDYIPYVEEFVYYYYTMLECAPHDAWRNFTVGAQYMHVDGDVICESSDFKPAVGQYQIHSNIMYQQFFECKFRIRSINIQHTFDTYLVLVTGDLSRDRCPAVMFIQSFLIDRQEEINQFSISNSILKVYTMG